MISESGLISGYHWHDRCQSWRDPFRRISVHVGSCQSALAVNPKPLMGSFTLERSGLSPLYSPCFGRYSIHYFPHRFPLTPYVFPDRYLITSQLVSPLATSKLQPVPLLPHTCPGLPCTFPTIPPSAGNPPHLRGWALITPSLLGSRFTWSTHIASLKSLPTVEAPVSLVFKK